MRLFCWRMVFLWEECSGLSVRGAAALEVWTQSFRWRIGAGKGVGKSCFLGWGGAGGGRVAVGSSLETEGAG